MHRFLRWLRLKTFVYTHALSRATMKKWRRATETSCLQCPSPLSDRHKLCAHQTDAKFSVVSTRGVSLKSRTRSIAILRSCEISWSVATCWIWYPRPRRSIMKTTDSSRWLLASLASPSKPICTISMTLAKCWATTFCRVKKYENPKHREKEEALRKVFTEQVKAEENRFRQWEQQVRSHKTCSYGPYANVDAHVAYPRTWSPEQRLGNTARTNQGSGGWVGAAIPPAWSLH